MTLETFVADPKDAPSVFPIAGPHDFERWRSGGFADEEEEDEDLLVPVAVPPALPAVTRA